MFMNDKSKELWKFLLIKYTNPSFVKEIKEDGKDKVLVTDDGKSYKTITGQTCCFQFSKQKRMP